MLQQKIRQALNAGILPGILYLRLTAHFFTAHVWQRRSSLQGATQQMPGFVPQPDPINLFSTALLPSFKAGSAGARSGRAYLLAFEQQPLHDAFYSNYLLSCHLLLQPPGLRSVVQVKPFQYGRMVCPPTALRVCNGMSQLVFVIATEAGDCPLQRHGFKTLTLPPIPESAPTGSV